MFIARNLLKSSRSKPVIENQNKKSAFPTQIKADKRKSRNRDGEA